MLGTDILEQDDKDIRDRQKRCEDSLLERDANSCEDQPLEKKNEEDENVGPIRALGDVTINYGDTAIKKNATDITQQQPPPPPPEKKNGKGKWVLPAVLGASLLGGGIGLGLLINRPKEDEKKIPPIYDIEVQPFRPFTIPE